MKEIPCGCCEGIEKLTPLATANRPGLGALRYRIGTHATFLETMLARLSNLCLGSEDDCKEGKGRYPLQDLKTRERSDPAIALFDAWATVADVLTFYQELIANEGYLRTATERRSILELARLVGYELRHGVASSVYLAYTLEDNFNDEVIIPKGARSQSVPGPGELPQSFETSEDLKTRARWNNLKPRTTQPQQVTPPGHNLDSSTEAPNIRTLYFQGTATNLKPNDPLLIDFGTQQLYRVQDVTPDTLAERTMVTAQPWLQIAVPTGKPTSSPVAALPQILPALEKPPSTRPPNSLRLSRSIDQAFAAKADTAPQLLTTLRPELSSILYEAMANLPVTPAPVVQVYVLRTRASVFGHNAPLEPIKNTDGVVIGFKEWDLKKFTGVTTEGFEIVTMLKFPANTNVIEIISTIVKISGQERRVVI